MKRTTLRLWCVLLPALAGCNLDSWSKVNWPEQYPLSAYSRKQLNIKTLPLTEDARLTKQRADADKLANKEEKAAALKVIEAEESKVLDAPLVFPDKLRDFLAQAMFDKFGDPLSPYITNVSTGTEAEALKRGRDLYHVHCVHCHGIAGGGNGPTAPFLYPRPRDYRRGLFKWKATQQGTKPLREDLVHVIKEGAAGSSMPPFRLLPEEEIQRLVDYVVFLSKRGEVEFNLILQAASMRPSMEGTQTDSALENEIASLGLESSTAEKIKKDRVSESDIEEFKTQLNDELENAFASVLESWAKAGEGVINPDKTRPDWDYDSPEYEQSVLRGREVFLGKDVKCHTCHGKDGQAKWEDIGPEERRQLVDKWEGRQLMPRNLAQGLYRGGRRPLDIYRRIRGGIEGGPMPKQGPAIKDEQVWDLVNFVRTLPYRPDLLPMETEKATPHAAGH